MKDSFAYRRQGRRPAVWLAAGCLGFVVSAGMMDGAPYPMWILWVIGGLPVVWVLITNPTDGMLIDNDRLVLSPWRNPMILARKDIDHVRLRGKSTATEVTLVMASGNIVEVNPRDLPEGRKLHEAFARFGLRVAEV